MRKSFVIIFATFFFASFATSVFAQISIQWSNFFTLAQNAGVFDFYLPFVLVFAIFYALLTRSRIFGSDAQGKRISAIVALVAGFYVVGYTPVGGVLINFASYLGNLFTSAAVIIVTLVVFLMIIYLVVPDINTKKFKGWWQVLILLIGLLVLAMFFNAGGGQIFGFVNNLGIGINFSGQDFAVIVLILITVAVIYWLTKGESSKSSDEKS